MSIFSDIFGGISDAVSSVFDKVPGSDWLKKAYGQGSSWLVDIARDPRGYWILQVANEAFVVAPVAYIAGPQVASIAWALPGLVKGDSFSEAYIGELARRIEQVIVFFAGKGASEAAQKEIAESLSAQAKALAANPELQRIITNEAIAKTGLGVEDALAQLHMTPADLAARFGGREDVAAMVINYLLHKPVYAMSQFDVATGRRIVVKPIGKKDPVDVARAQLAAARQALVAGTGSAAEVARLEQAYANALVAASKTAELKTPKDLFDAWQIALAKYGPDSKITQGFHVQYVNAARTEAALNSKAGPPLQTGFPIVFASSKPSYASVEFGDDPTGGQLRGLGTTVLLLSPVILTYLLLRRG